MIMRKHIFKLMVVVLAFAISACTTTVRSAKEYYDPLSRAKMSAILPPKAEVRATDLSGRNDRMYDYENHIEPIIAETLRNKLAEKGYNVDLITKNDLKKNKLYKEVDDLLNNYEAEIGAMYSQFRKKKDVALNLDSNIGKNYKYSKYGSNIVVLSRYAETVQSSGQRAANFAIDIATSLLLGSSAGTSGVVEAANLAVSFVDLETGQILWANQAIEAESLVSSGFNNFSSAEELDKSKVENLVDSILSDLPNRDKLGLDNQNQD
jgi:PBP1b-binding outer membrane lipoprotein LpoB